MSDETSSPVPAPAETATKPATKPTGPDTKPVGSGATGGSRPSTVPGSAREKTGSGPAGDKDKDKTARSAPGETAPTSSGALAWMVAFVAILGVSGWIFWPEISPLVKPYTDMARPYVNMVRGISAPEDTAPAQEAPAQAPAQEAPAQATALAPAPAQEQPAQEPVQQAVQEATQETAEETTPAAVQVPGPGGEEVRVDVVSRDAAPAAPAAAVPDAPSATPAVQAADPLVEQRLRDEIKTLESRIGEMQSRLDEYASRPAPSEEAVGLLRGAERLRLKVLGARPYVDELAAFDAVAGTSPALGRALERLRPHAETGLAGMDGLAVAFGPTARRVMAAHNFPGEDDWLGRIKKTLSGLVSVRRIDIDEISDPVERQLAIAEAALGAGDLATAVQAVEGINGEPGIVAGEWLGQAQARLGAMAALDAINEHILENISTPSGGTAR